MSETYFNGFPVMVSPTLPIIPSTGEWAKRLVRHGLADVLEWLGEKPGPEPDDATHAIYSSDLAYPGHQVAFVSQELYDRLKEMT